MKRPTRNMTHRAAASGRKTIVPTSRKVNLNPIIMDSIKEGSVSRESIRAVVKKIASQRRKSR